MAGVKIVNMNEEGTRTAEGHCTHGDLTDSFGWIVQAILACLAFTCLILKRFCEPRKERRPWIIWFYDTSKQGLGALVIHFANLFLAELFHGDPCTWYIVSFLLDSSLGLLFIFVGIRLTQRIARRKGCPLLIFGEYGKPPQPAAWLAQCGAYVGLMLVEKVLITLLIQLNFWDRVRDVIMSPFKDPKIEVAVVVLIIPFFINAMMFWVVDNFLMHKHGRWRDESLSQIPVCGKNKVHYSTTDKLIGSECEVLLLADDDELDTNQRHRASSSNLTMS